MIIFDMLLIVPFIWAIYIGFRDGVVVQLCGLAGLFVGVYLAFRFGAKVGEWLSIDPTYATIVGFVIVLIAIVIGLAILGRVLRGLLGLVGLGILDKMGGAIFSILKTGLILGLLLYCFDYVNNNAKWVEKKELDRSKIYNPLVNVAKKSFPYIDFVKKQLIPNDDQPAPRDSEQHKT